MLVHEEFSITKIGEQRDGLIAVMIDKAIERALDDILRASDIKDARKVNIELSFIPRIEQDQVLDIVCEWRVKGKVPDRMASTVFLPREVRPGQRRLVFSKEAPDNPRQHTMGFADEVKRDAARETPPDRIEPTYGEVRDPE